MGLEQGALITQKNSETGPFYTGYLAPITLAMSPVSKSALYLLLASISQPPWYLAHQKWDQANAGERR